MAECIGGDGGDGVGCVSGVCLFKENLYPTIVPGQTYKVFCLYFKFVQLILMQVDKKREAF